jgi:uncharacterized short protein YbdD (DUF466 family)
MTETEYQTQTQYYIYWIEHCESRVEYTKLVEQYNTLCNGYKKYHSNVVIEPIPQYTLVEQYQESIQHHPSGHTIGADLRVVEEPVHHEHVHHEHVHHEHVHHEQVHHEQVHHQEHVHHEQVHHEQVHHEPVHFEVIEQGQEHHVDPHEVHIISEEGVICFPKSSPEAQRLVAQGAHVVHQQHVVIEEHHHILPEVIDQTHELTEAQFESGCNAYVQKISACHTRAEYQQVFEEYEHYVNEYAQTHPNCHFPPVPEFTSSGVDNAHTITIEIAHNDQEFATGCNGYINQMKHCQTKAEYETIYEVYEAYVQEYSKTHPGCSYPSAPSFHH